MSDQIRQCDAGHLSLGSGTWECPWCKLAEANERLRLCEVPDGWEVWRIKAEAEVERLLAELDRPKHETLRQLADAVERNEHLKAEVARLRGGCSCEARAEVERLRAALREISLLEDDPLRASKTRSIIARAALRGEGEK